MWVGYEILHETLSRLKGQRSRLQGHAT